MGNGKGQRRKEGAGEVLVGNPSVFARLRRFGFLKLSGLALALGLVMGILSVHLIPYTVRAGVPPLIADKQPYLGFLCGVLIAFVAAVSRAVMGALQIGLAIPLIFFALLGWGLSVVMGLLWSLAVLDVALPAAAIVGTCVLLAAGLSKLYTMFESKRQPARQNRNR